MLIRVKHFCIGLVPDVVIGDTEFVSNPVDVAYRVLGHLSRSLISRCDIWAARSSRMSLTLILLAIFGSPSCKLFETDVSF